MRDGLDLLAAAIWCQRLALGLDEQHNRIREVLELHHAAAGTPNATVTVMRQAATARLLADGDLSQAEVSVVVGCSVATTERDCGLLRRLYCREARPDLWDEDLSEELAA